MDALFITTDLDTLREGSAAEARAKDYAALGKHIMVFVLHTTARSALPHRALPTLWIVPIHGPFLLWTIYKAVRAARRELYFQKKFQVEIIDSTDAFAAICAGWLIARKFKSPLHITTLRSAITVARPQSGLMQMLSAPFLHFLLTRADSVSTDSEKVREALLRTSADWLDRVFLLPRSVDIGLMKKETTETGSIDLHTKYPQFKIVLLTVAPLTAEYNPDLAIYTIAGVVQSYTFAGLVMVGEGPMKDSLKALARKLGVESHVVFEPWTGDLPSYYKSAHIFLVTASRQEYGNTIAEAASASCAILSTNVGLAAAFLKHEESAYICDVKDPLCFVKTATMLITHSPVRDRVRLNGMLAFEGFLAQEKPAERADTRVKAWEAARKHFVSAHKKTPLAPKAARAKDEHPSK
ncbi:MAG TPA: glycosyltransferase [Candidatus Paceibacterota bacterium]